MTKDLKLLEVKLWGDYACFTRPETKVERVSYPMITPSAARGALESIFWKPEFTWSILSISVLQPIQYMSIMRNEISHRQNERTARGWEQKGGNYDGTSTKGPPNRVQRHALILRDVAYLIRAEPVLRPDVEANAAKYRDQFRRRVASGRCFATPYLGCREFSASFSEPSPQDRPIGLSADLGLMLLEIEYRKDGSGYGTPRFFQASLESGVLKVPQTHGQQDGQQDGQQEAQCSAN